MTGNNLYIVFCVLAICQLPWPEVDRSCRVKELGNMKCQLPYKGEFLIEAVIHNNVKIAGICQGGDSNDDYDYKLFCNDHDIGGCISACSGICQTFRFRVSEPRTVILEVDASCLENEGQVEIWDVIVHGVRKRSANIFNRN